MKRIVGAVVAVAVAAVLIQASGWSPLCPLFERWSAEWVMLGCWYGEPPPGSEG